MKKTNINYIGKFNNKPKNKYFKEYNKNKFNKNTNFIANKNKYKYKNRFYCHICKKHSHNTDRCRYNLLTNKKQIKNKEYDHDKLNNMNFIGKINNSDDNRDFDDNINYDDIKTTHRK